MKKPKLVIEAGAQYDGWGTPEWILDVVRESHGPITLDLASNAQANKLVRAKRFYSVLNPCPLTISVPNHDVIWCNPPGPVELVRAFWVRWLMDIENGGRGAFLIFNLDHWRSLSRPEDIKRCSPFYVGLPRQRLKFVDASSQYNHPSGLVSTHPLKSFDGNVVRW